MKLSEPDFTIPVLRILNAQPSGQLPMADIKNALEGMLLFSPEDLAPSQSRPPEPTWRQIAGNITSHKGQPGNMIYEGYADYISKADGLRITAAGTALITKLGYEL